jgi:hypothetical protein
MSQHSVYKTRIRIWDESIVINAIRELAAKLNATVTNYVKDYYGNRHEVLIGIMSPELPRGIGFNIKDGKLTVEGDRYGYGYTFDRYKALAKEYVKAYITKKQIYRLYPAAKVETRIEGKEVVMEVTL